MKKDIFTSTSQTTLSLLKIIYTRLYQKVSF